MLTQTKKPRICVLTYPALSGLVHAAEARFRDRAWIEVDEYQAGESVFRGLGIGSNAVNPATAAVDVVVAAGYHATLLRQQLDMPVATIDVTGFDLLQALQQARSLADRVGLVVYQGSISELEAVRDLLRVNLEQVSYQSPAQARDALSELRSRGVLVVVGSSLVVALAEEMGMRGVLFYTASSIDRALERAVEMGDNAVRQRARFDSVNAVLTHLHEAILATDTRHRITAINPPMRLALGLGDDSVLGKRLPEVAQELSVASILSGETQDEPSVLQLQRGTYWMSRTAVHEGGAVSGAVVTLRETAAIQRADSAIRQQRRQKSVSAKYSLDMVVGDSPAMTAARQSAQRCAASSATVLITGETGTGKELFAQAIHNASTRRNGPFVALNCASFPESLLESELFGYDEGSFTGSRKGGKVGLFEAAHTGTVFLDEIGDMPVGLQTRLLRVLQEREVVRLGTVVPVSIDVRVIAATHHPLVERVHAGAFRADLYYRLNILHIALPALRERGGDLLTLAEMLLHSKLREQRSQTDAPGLSSGPVPSLAAVSRWLHALHPALLGYHWPGNIRELENLMERVAVLFGSVGGSVGLQPLAPLELAKALPELFVSPQQAAAPRAEPALPASVTPVASAGVPSTVVAVQPQVAAERVETPVPPLAGSVQAPGLPLAASLPAPVADALTTSMQQARDMSAAAAAASAVQTAAPAPQAETPPQRPDLRTALARARGNRQLAAEWLGISRTTLWRRMKEEGLVENGAA